MTTEKKEMADLAEMFSRLNPDIQEELLEFMRELARKDEKQSPESGTAKSKN